MCAANELPALPDWMLTAYRASELSNMTAHDGETPIEPRRLTFFFMHGETRARFSIVAKNRHRALDMAEIVRKQWGIYGGGPKPAELKPAKAKARDPWKAPILKVWRAQIEDRDHAGAMLTGEALGVVYFADTPANRAFALAAPIPMEGMPEGFASARRCDGRWVVADLLSGRAVGAHGHGSRKAAEEHAREVWERKDSGEREEILRRAREAAGTIDPEAMRTGWCRAYGIEDPRGGVAA